MRLRIRSCLLTREGLSEGGRQRGKRGAWLPEAPVCLEALEFQASHVSWLDSETAALGEAVAVMLEKRVPRWGVFSSQSICACLSNEGGLSTLNF